jgi:flagellar protein FlgJ
VSSVPRPDSATDFSQFTGLRAAAQRKDPAALKQAAKQFEALFTEQILKTARETKFGDDLSGEQGDYYNDLFDQQMAIHLASGKGLGLADMLVKQLGGTSGIAPAGTAAATSTASADTASTTAADASTPESFVASIRPQAEKAAAELGVPTRALLAHAALETSWGQHIPSSAGTSSNNLFGIKASGTWTGSSATSATQEFEAGRWSQQNAAFRSYGSVAQSFNDYVHFLKNNPRYADALKAGTVSGFAQGLQDAGYATDPDYAQKLIQVAYSPQMSRAIDATRSTGEVSA